MFQPDFDRELIAHNRAVPGAPVKLGELRRAIATLTVMVLLLSVAGPTSADVVCRVVAGRSEDDLPKIAAKKCQPGETLFLGYRDFVPAIDVAVACDATKPIVITGNSVICTFSGLKTVR